MKGFINLIKPENMSSAKAVAIVKKRFNTPCGHMGTLDPMASGVLPIGVGQASRLFDYTLDKEKTYVADFEFGYITDTLDKTGVTIKETSVTPTERAIKDVLSLFVGEIEQVPPQYSAKCVDGKRGYQLARKGLDFTLSAKKVTVLGFELIEQTGEKTFRFKIDCKGGTYIRSLARDLGYKLNSLATMVKLVRTKSGVFDIEHGVTPEEFINCENPIDYLIPPENTLSFNNLVLTKDRAIRLLNGVYENYGFADGIYSVYNEKEFWGVGEVKDGILRMKSYVR